MEVFNQQWEADFDGGPLILFHHKLKRVKKALSQLRKDTFGNIFLEIITLEEVIKLIETKFELDPSGTNREKLHKSQAEIRKHLQREEEFWK